MIFICVLFYYGFDLFNRSTSVSTTLRIPKRLFYVCVPISAAIMGAYLTRDIVVMFYRAIVTPKNKTQKG
jgi:TRAP-type C4-dicarboxylate transport system permease small subunit